MTQKLKMQTPNGTHEQIGKLFPNVLTETRDTNGKMKKAIDFDLLKQMLTDEVADSQDERYRLDWPGKKGSLLKANTPITKTLRPCREESVNFDTTKNLYIEGDNFEVLKILQESYLGKIKMIYIDPPYNTGNDFIYKDNFKTSREEYEECIGAVDEDGGRLFKNTDSNGRFHSDWLSMMYERLLIARDLLKEDGVIFISIDDNEVHNLRKICDEIFGEGNKVGVVIWKNVTDNNPTNIAMEHEYILCYAKQKTVIDTVWKSKVADAKEQLIKIGINLNNRFKNQEELQTAYTNWFRENKRFLGQLDRYKYIDKGGIYTGSQSVHNPGKEGYRYDVIHPVTKKPCKQPLMGYRFPEQTMKNLLDKGKILFGKDDFKIIEIKVYVEEYEDKLSSVIEMDGRLGAYNLRDIFIENKKIFDNSKPEQLLKTVFSYILNYEDLILDFFSGSATTAHAVMQLNAEDNGNRQFIMVQLPEKTDEKSEAYKAGYKTIADIGKERIRRAGKKIKEENKGNEGIEKLDIGFRVYKTDTSNMKDVKLT